MYTKDEVIALLSNMLETIDSIPDLPCIIETHELPLDTDGTVLPLETYALQCYSRGWEEARDIVEKTIDELKGAENGTD